MPAERYVHLGCLNGSKDNYTMDASVTDIRTNKGFYKYKITSLFKLCLMCFVAKDTHLYFVMEAFTCKPKYK